MSESASKLAQAVKNIVAGADQGRELGKRSLHGDRVAVAMADTELPRDKPAVVTSLDSARVVKPRYDIPRAEARREQIENSVTFGSDLIAKQVMQIVKTQLLQATGPVGDAMRQREIVAGQDANSALEEKGSRKKKYCARRGEGSIHVVTALAHRVNDPEQSHEKDQNVAQSGLELKKDDLLAIAETLMRELKAQRMPLSLTNTQKSYSEAIENAVRELVPEGETELLAAALSEAFERKLEEENGRDARPEPYNPFAGLSEVELKEPEASGPRAKVSSRRGATEAIAALIENHPNPFTEAHTAALEEDVLVAFPDAERGKVLAVYHQAIEERLLLATVTEDETTAALRRTLRALPFDDLVARNRHITEHPQQREVLAALRKQLLLESLVSGCVLTGLAFEGAFPKARADLPPGLREIMPSADNGLQLADTVRRSLDTLADTQRMNAALTPPSPDATPAARAEAFTEQALLRNAFLTQETKLLGLAIAASETQYRPELVRQQAAALAARSGALGISPDEAQYALNRAIEQRKAELQQTLSWKERDLIREQVLRIAAEAADLATLPPTPGLIEARAVALTEKGVARLADALLPDGVTRPGKDASEAEKKAFTDHQVVALKKAQALWQGQFGKLPDATPEQGIVAPRDVVATLATLTDAERLARMALSPEESRQTAARFDPQTRLAALRSDFVALKGQLGNVALGSDVKQYLAIVEQHLSTRIYEDREGMQKLFDAGVKARAEARRLSGHQEVVQSLKAFETKLRAEYEVRLACWEATSFHDTVSRRTRDYQTPLLLAHEGSQRLVMALRDLGVPAAEVDKTAQHLIHGSQMQAAERCLAWMQANSARFGEHIWKDGAPQVAGEANFVSYGENGHNSVRNGFAGEFAHEARRAHTILGYQGAEAEEHTTTFLQGIAESYRQQYAACTERYRDAIDTILRGSPDTERVKLTKAGIERDETPKPDPRLTLIKLLDTFDARGEDQAPLWRTEVKGGEKAEFPALKERALAVIGSHAFLKQRALQNALQGENLELQADTLQKLSFTLAADKKTIVIGRSDGAALGTGANGVQREMRLDMARFLELRAEEVDYLQLARRSKDNAPPFATQAELYFSGVKPADIHDRLLLEAQARYSIEHVRRYSEDRDWALNGGTLGHILAAIAEPGNSLVKGLSFGYLDMADIAAAVQEGVTFGYLDYDKDRQRKFVDFQAQQRDKNWGWGATAFNIANTAVLVIGSRGAIGITGGVARGVAGFSAGTSLVIGSLAYGSLNAGAVAEGLSGMGKGALLAGGGMVFGSLLARGAPAWLTARAANSNNVVLRNALAASAGTANVAAAVMNKVSFGSAVIKNAALSGTLLYSFNGFKMDWEQFAGVMLGGAAIARHQAVQQRVAALRGLTAEQRAEVLNRVQESARVAKLDRKVEQHERAATTTSPARQAELSQRIAANQDVIRDAKLTAKADWVLGSRWSVARVGFKAGDVFDKGMTAARGKVSSLIDRVSAPLVNRVTAALQWRNELAAIKAEARGQLRGKSSEEVDFKRVEFANEVRLKQLQVDHATKRFMEAKAHRREAAPSDREQARVKENAARQDLDTAQRDRARANARLSGATAETNSLRRIASDLFSDGPLSRAQAYAAARQAERQALTGVSREAATERLRTHRADLSQAEARYAAAKTTIKNASDQQGLARGLDKPAADCAWRRARNELLASNRELAVLRGKVKAAQEIAEPHSAPVRLAAQAVDWSGRMGVRMSLATASGVRSCVRFGWDFGQATLRLPSQLVRPIRDYFAERRALRLSAADEKANLSGKSLAEREDRVEKLKADIESQPKNMAQNADEQSKIREKLPGLSDKAREVATERLQLLQAEAAKAARDLPHLARRLRVAEKSLDTHPGWLDRRAARSQAIDETTRKFAPQDGSRLNRVERAAVLERQGDLHRQRTRVTEELRALRGEVKAAENRHREASSSDRSARLRDLRRVEEELALKRVQAAKLSGAAQALQRLVPNSETFSAFVKSGTNQISLWLRHTQALLSRYREHGAVERAETRERVKVRATSNSEQTAGRPQPVDGDGTNLGAAVEGRAAFRFLDTQRLRVFEVGQWFRQKWYQASAARENLTNRARLSPEEVKDLNQRLDSLRRLREDDAASPYQENLRKIDQQIRAIELRLRAVGGGGKPETARSGATANVARKRGDDGDNDGGDGGTTPGSPGPSPTSPTPAPKSPAADPLMWDDSWLSKPSPRGGGGSAPVRPSSSPLGSARESSSASSSGVAPVAPPAVSASPRVDSGAQASAVKAQQQSPRASIEADDAPSITPQRGSITVATAQPPSAAASAQLKPVTPRSGTGLLDPSKADPDAHAPWRRGRELSSYERIEQEQYRAAQSPRPRDGSSTRGAKTPLGVDEQGNFVFKPSMRAQPIDAAARGNRGAVRDAAMPKVTIPDGMDESGPFVAKVAPPAAARVAVKPSPAKIVIPDGLDESGPFVGKPAAKSQPTPSAVTVAPPPVAPVRIVPALKPAPRVAPQTAPSTVVLPTPAAKRVDTATISAGVAPPQISNRLVLSPAPSNVPASEAQGRSFPATQTATTEQQRRRRREGVDSLLPSDETKLPEKERRLANEEQRERSRRRVDLRARGRRFEKQGAILSGVLEGAPGIDELPMNGGDNDEAASPRGRVAAGVRRFDMDAPDIEIEG